MRGDLPWKPLLIGLAFAIVTYVGGFWGIEYIRNRKGPWLVTYSINQGMPTLQVSQPKLGISDVQIQFQTNWTSTNLPQHVVFENPAQKFPRPAPFGEIIYQDTTFLPGAVTVKAFNHYVEFLPRALLVDREEFDWKKTRSVIIPTDGTRPHPSAQ